MCMKRYSISRQPFFLLAPMDDVTDVVFRRIIESCAAPDFYMTEFVNVDGLQSPGRPKLLKKLRSAPEETNLIVQLWGKNPDNFYKTAAEIANGTFTRELGLSGTHYVGVDLNMGCPAKSEVQNNTCSALIKPENRELARDIINATKDGLSGRLPLSVKTRLGFSEVDYTWHEFLMSQEIALLTVHGRTKKEMSKVPAQWEKIGHIRSLRDTINPAVLVVGNGDVMNRQHGEELIEKYKLDGVMIGRGVFHDPYAFAAKSPWQQLTRTEKLELYRKHVGLFAGTWRDRERPIHTLNKFCKIYVQGFDGAKELREKLMQADSTQELLALLDQAVKQPLQ